MSELNGKVALVTGAASGQGAEQARALVDKGARVAICDVDSEQGRALVETLPKGSAQFFLLDVTSDESWGQTTAAIGSVFGRLDILVNNAGIYQSGTLYNTEPDQFDRMIAVNQRGVYLGMRHVIEQMGDSGGGSIINIVSIAGLTSAEGSFAYGASKWAARGMTLSAAAELAPHQIRVNSIFPGNIDTPMLASNSAKKRQRMLQTIPMGRIGKPAEVAALVTFLASSESAYITGAEIKIDGGRSL